MKEILESTKDKSEIDTLTGKFFSLFTNANGSVPGLDNIHRIFIPEGIIVKNINAKPEIYNLKQFIEPRRKILTDGTLKEFQEEEVSETTSIFGNIAQRFSTYKKSGILSGNKFESKGVKTIQFIKTPEGWKISALAWDDED
jgi:ribosomal-protein-serine acetyltransferase